MLPSLWQMSCPLVRGVVKKVFTCCCCGIRRLDFCRRYWIPEKKEQEVVFLEKELRSICILWSWSLSIVIYLFLFQKWRWLFVVYVHCYFIHIISAEIFRLQLKRVKKHLHSIVIMIIDSDFLSCFLSFFFVLF